MKRHFKKGETLSNEEFIEKAKEKHGDRYDYSKTNYLGARVKVIIICPKHKSFYQNPMDHIRGHGCKKCHSDSLIRWSINQDEFLIENYKKYGAYWCSEKLGKTDHSIRGRAVVLGLSQKQKHKHKIVPPFIISGLISRAKKDGREIDTEIDADYIYNLFLEQGGKCKLSGWDIKFGKGSKETTVSVDRIDSKRGYLKDNIQLAHKIVNRTKLNCTEYFFYKMCESVYKNRKDLEKREIVWEEDITNDTENPRIRSVEFDSE